ncbi:MAG: hypothetical protein AAF846_19225 [Chloroflexota bacterium]
MSDYLSRILIGALSIGIIAAIIFAVSQFASLNDAQLALDTAESEMTEAVETANAIQATQAQTIAEQDESLSAMQATAEQSALEADEALSAMQATAEQSLADAEETVAVLQATSDQLANDIEASNTQSADTIAQANAIGTESQLAIDTANEAATQSANVVDDANATVTQVADDLVNIQQTADANADALTTAQTRSAELANLATEQSAQLADAQATQSNLQSALTENANFISTQASELTAAQQALDMIATSVASLDELATDEAEATEAVAVEETPEMEMTAEAEVTEAVIVEETPETEMTVEAEVTEVVAVEETPEMEMTEVVTVEETPETEVTAEAEATEVVAVEETPEMEMTAEAEITEEANTTDEMTDQQILVIPDSLVSFEGEGYTMLVPMDFLSYDAQRDRTEAIETFRERGSAYAQALTTAINSPPSTVFLGFADTPNADGTIDQIIIIEQAVEDFTTMDAYLQLITPTNRIEIMEREVISVDGQEVGRVRSEQTGARDVITHVVLYIYYDETAESVYVIALSAIDDAIDDRLAEYEAIGQSFVISQDD